MAIDITSFIKDSRDRGMSDDAIRSSLLNMGVDAGEVSAALPAIVAKEIPAQLNIPQQVQPQTFAPQQPQAQPVAPVIAAASPLGAVPAQGSKEAIMRVVGTSGTQPAAPSSGAPATNPIFGNQPSVAVALSQPAPKSKKPLILVIATILILGGGGGAYAYYSYINSPPQVLAATLTNVKKVTSFSMSSDLKVFASSTNLQSVTGKDSGNLELNTTGDFEFADIKQPNFSIDTTLTTDILPGLEPINLAMIFLGAEKAFYFKPGNLGNIMGVDLADLNNVWVSVQSVTTTASSSEIGSSPIPNLNLDASKIVDSAASSTVFSNPPITIVKEFPRETVNDQDSFHYQLGLDEEKLKNDPLIQQRLKDGTLKPEDLQKQLDVAKQTQIDIWISKAEKLPTKLALHNESQDTSGTSWKVDFVATFSNINEKVSIVAPGTSRPIEEVFAEVITKIFSGATKNGSTVSKTIK